MTLGWADFDPAVVRALKQGSAENIDKAPDGGMRCPLLGHDHWLQWQDGDYRRGSEPDSELGVSFRVSGTYVHADPLDNFVAGRRLIEGALAGRWTKAETWRLGHEQSEDAVSWNVFRLLQETRKLRVAAQILAGIQLEGEPRLILWGRQIDSDATRAVPSLLRVLDKFERGFAQQTEPDVVLYAPGEVWIFIEAKFTSPTATYGKTPERIPGWIARYAGTPGVFDPDGLTGADPQTFPEQLLRNVAIANAISEPPERSMVVSLTRRGAAATIENLVHGYLDENWRERFRVASWEDLYLATRGMPELDPLARYMEGKSAGLEPAFDIRREA